MEQNSSGKPKSNRLTIHKLNHNGSAGSALAQTVCCSVLLVQPCGIPHGLLLTS